MTRRKLMLGNWKMNKNRSEVPEFASTFRRTLGESLAAILETVDAGIAPSFFCLESLASEFKESGWWSVAQNAHFAQNGAFTGEIALGMLKEVGVSRVLIGHSERRQYFAESDQVVAEKVSACVQMHIHPIICIGETLELRKSNLAEKTVESQLRFAVQSLAPSSAFTIAYEPVWAIGSGLAASASQAQDMHKLIRATLSEIFDDSVANRMRILYGGSTKPENIDELLAQPDIDGALVGGASLQGESFAKMVYSAALASRRD